MTHRNQALLQIGAMGAIVGAIVSVAAGVGYGSLPFGASTDAMLGFLAGRPAGYWPLVHLGFSVGALLWVVALLALAASFTRGVASAVGWLGAASVAVGAAVHLVNASIDGFALDALAEAWAAAPTSEQADLVLAADALHVAVDGTWAMTISLFHGVPFVLFGVAVALDEQYPAWLGWIGAFDGAASLVVGTAMFLGAGSDVESLFPALAVVISLWMIAIGLLLWRHSSDRFARPVHTHARESAVTW